MKEKRNFTMNDLDIYHLDDSTMCFAINPYKVCIRLRVRKNLNINDIYVHYGPKYKFKTFKKVRMELFCQTESSVYYQAILNLDDRRLSYYFVFTVDNVKYFYTEDGFSSKFDETMWQYSLFQLAYINDSDIHKEVSWAKDAIFYQIFVDRFHQGDKTKDTSYINMKQFDRPDRMSFYGGDLLGIIDKIPYLKNLGVNAIYLTPIFDSNSNHKYNITDYKKIDWMFGNDEKLHMLIEQLHKNNIKIVLDAVFNHCAYNNPIFEDVKKYSSKSKYFDWFIIHGKEIDFSDDHFNYDGFGTCKYMPKFNTSNKNVEKYLLDIATYYIKEFDIDGWRLDVGDEVSHEFWRSFRKACKQCKDDFIILGEVWPDAHSYLLGDQFDAVMNYPFRKAVINYLLNHFNSEILSDDLNKCLISNTSIVNNMMYNLLDSHDSPRFVYELKNDLNRYKQALSLMFTFVGMPALFYGDETHLSGGHDPDCRLPMVFEGEHFDYEFFNFVKNFINIRKTSKALKQGNIRIFSKNNLFYLERYDENNRFTLILNNTKNPVKLQKIGNVVISNLYDDKNVLSDSGFVLFKN